MRVIILGAGQGSRLAPLTDHMPKALLEISGRSLVARQVDAFVAAGADEIFFVSGFMPDAVDAALAVLKAEHPDIMIQAIHNPFFQVADNTGSCWVARHVMDRDFMLVNGDNLIRADIIERVLASPAEAITLSVDVKDIYDDDDMKVILEGDRLKEIGKHLPLDHSDGESIGLLYFRNEGPRIFREALESALREESALKEWYLAVIGRISKNLPVKVCSIAGLEWCELDYRADYMRACEIAEKWDRENAG